ncbi:DUF992 domain-containing protein [Acuticoccus sp.]|uniref:DUF992 domain-containing protein n=1 Tax=Acuticoccus sp. TaxID=1904378 RepID=UPI003B51E6E1
MFKKTIMAALALVAASLVPALAADLDPRLQERAAVVDEGPEGRVRVGVLACTIEGGVGFIIGSSKAVVCTFTNNRQGVTEVYVGTIRRFGLDIGFTGEQYLRWIVFAPQAANATERLAGTYTGLSAGGALGLAFGANALLGGSADSVVLQPFSLQAGTGLNLAAGVTSFRIERQ